MAADVAPAICVECQVVAAVYCAECGSNLCQRCAIELHKYKILSKHHISPVPDAAASAPSVTAHRSGIVSSSSATQSAKDRPSGRSASSVQGRLTPARKQSRTFQKQWVAALPVLLQMSGSFFAVLVTFLVDDTTVLVVSSVVITALSWAVAGLGGARRMLKLAFRMQPFCTQNV
jgi:hypothetical protein